MVGGGYTGLWTALRSIERYPGSSVVVLDGGRCGDQASGRNGGFTSASLTHGFGNGLARWPSELAELDRLGAENLAAIGATIGRYGIDCNWEQTGELSVALAEHQLDELRSSWRPTMADHGHVVEVLDAAAVRSSSTLRPTSADCSIAPGTPWSSRPGWRGGFAGPAWTAGS